VNRYISDLAGTALNTFRVGAAGAASLLKYITGGVAIRDEADSADAALTASQIKISGDSFIINSDAAGSGADWTITIQRPASGMGAAWTMTLPPDDGSPGQVLTTDGSGVTTWTTVSAGATNMILTDDTTLAFGDSSPVTMFTKPAGSKPKLVRVYVDMAFNGTTPTLSIGIVGTTSKYGSTTQVDLKTVGVYEWDPGIDVTAGSEALIATYAASSSSAGAARIEVDYVVPS
jgi:hypothetical protein